VWWVKKWDGKRQVRMSTGCTDYNEAQRRAATLLVPVVMDKEGDMLEGVVEKARRLHRQASEARAGMVLLEDAWRKADYHGSRGDAKPGTLRRAKEAFDTFVRDAQALGAVEVGDLTKPMVEKILDGHPPRFAQVMYQYAHAVLTRLGCPAELWPPKPRHAPSETTHREPLTPEQRGALLAEADRGVTRPQSKSDGAEFARLVRWMIHTGLRMSDAATLRMANINAEAMAVSRKMAKTSKAVWLPLHRELHEDVRRAAADGREMLFPMMARKEPHVLTTRFRRLFARAGVKGEPGQFCAHCLRTTFASICAENGVPMGVIQSWMGHSSQEVTRIYARVEDMRAKRAALANIPDLG
jgi:integrase